MTNLFKLGFDQVSDLMNVLVAAKFTPEMARMVIKFPTLATAIVEAASREMQKEMYYQAPNADARAEDIELGEGEYLVYVTYAPLPTRVELVKEFGEHRAAKIFDGRPFEKHTSRVGTAEIPGNKIFLVKHFNREIKSEEAIAEMGRLGYHPATHLEAYEFQKAYPQLQRKFWIVALGSLAMRKEGRSVVPFVAVLSGRGSRCFGNHRFGRPGDDSDWGPHARFLFVRN